MPEADLAIPADAFAKPREFLLRICAAGTTNVAGEMLGDFGTDEWVWLGKRIREYRLSPQFHRWASETSHWAWPGELQGQWAKRHGRWVEREFAQRKALADVGAVLSGAGIDYVVLKGGALALAAYPAPGLRPMRDIDILVPRDAIDEANRLIRALGFELPGNFEEHEVEDKHHLPLLQNRDGVRLELHHRLSEHGWPGEGALTERLLRVANPHDLAGHQVMLADPMSNALHLAAHAGLSHMFDNGPLVLSDLRHLDRTGNIDWRECRAIAMKLGLQRPLELSLALLQRFGPYKTVGGEVDVPHDHVERAAKLMTQELEQRWDRLQLRRHDHVEGASRSAIPWRAIIPSRTKLASAAGRDVDDPLRWLAYPRWLLDRGSRFLRARSDRSLVSAVKQDAALANWLDSSEI